VQDAQREVAKVAPAGQEKGREKGMAAAHPQGCHAHVSVNGPDNASGLGVVQLQILAHSCCSCVIQIIRIDPPYVLHLQSPMHVLPQHPVWLAAMNWQIQLDQLREISIDAGDQ
jgi:hypothetical protein